jgi:hypothetical protein
MLPPKTNKNKSNKTLMSQIMKKAILTFGLFSMMMVLTSFTTPAEIGGTQTTPQPPSKSLGIYEIGGTQTTPQPPRTGDLGISDIGGNQTTPKPPVRSINEIGGTQTTPQPPSKGLDA